MIDYSGDDASLDARVAKKLAWYYNNDRVDWTNIGSNNDVMVVKSFVQTDDIPKILPADLLVRVIDNSIGLRDAEDEIGAEGYLFAGAGKGSAETGGNAKGVAPWMMNRGYGFGSMTTSTRLLFGK